MRSDFPASGEPPAVSLLDRLPNSDFSGKFLVLGAAAWVLVRAAFAFVEAGVADVLGPPSLTLELPALLAIIAISSSFVVLDVLRKHERILLANLGVSLGGVALIGAIPALVAEMAVTLLATAFGG